MRTAPFELKADLVMTHAHGGSYFDAKMLASYFVSAGNFVHPVSRRDVGRDECERLDAFLKDARKAVTTAFDHREEYTAATASGRLDRLRAEAEGLMRTLFTLRSAGRPSTSRGRAAAEREGSLAMVDDDARPGHAAPPAFDDAEPFPALGGGAALTPLRAGCWCREASAAAAPTSDASFPALPTPAPSPSRASRLADAFGRRVGDASVFASSSATSYSAEALALAKSAPEYVQRVEEELDAFVMSDAARAALVSEAELRGRGRRAVANELCRAYGLSTVELGPRRSLHVLRTDRTLPPALRLSDAAKAAGGRGEGGDRFAIRLVDVECSLAALQAVTRPLGGSLAWRAAGAGGEPEATLTFADEATAADALAALCGGRRGGFRVETPSWAAAAAAPVAEPPRRNPRWCTRLSRAGRR